MQNWWRWLRADLARPETPMGRDLVTAGLAVTITVIAPLTTPGSWREYAALLPVVAAFVALGLGVRLRIELVAAVTIVLTTWVIGQRGHLQVAQFFPVMATLYAAWFLGSVVRAAVIMVVAASSAWLLAVYFVPDAGFLFVPWAAANLFVFVLGLTLRRQGSLIDQLDAAREELTRQAVAEERRRIARELHDLAGHTLAAMMLHVTGARHVLGRDPAEAEQALIEAEAVGRASLDQIRATVAALRTDESGTDQALASSADLVDLVDAYRRAGLDIELQMGDAAAGDGIDGPVGAALYRIAQESLANVARHASQNEVTMVVAVQATGTDHSVDPEVVTLSVTDQGTPPAAPPDTSPHFGLVGMRERARALGGMFTAGPHGDGWRVEATLPRAVSAIASRSVSPESAICDSELTERDNTCTTPAAEG